MTRPVSSAFRAFLQARTPHDGVILLLRLSHPQAGFTTQNWTDCEEDVVVGATTYASRRFTIPLPSDEEGVAEVQLDVDVRDMDDDLLEDILAASDDQPEVNVDVARRPDPDTVEATFYFQMRAATTDLGELVATLVYEPVLAEGFPGKTFNATGFPGLFA